MYVGQVRGDKARGHLLHGRSIEIRAHETPSTMTRTSTTVTCAGREQVISKSGSVIKTRLPVLGIDIGGVIVDRVGEDSDTSFFGTCPMDTPAVDGALSAIGHLFRDVFDGQVHIVSKAGPRISALSTEWLRQKGVFTEIGLPESNLWFVRARADKAPICKRLGVTHFIDDRMDILQRLTTVEHRYLFLGGLGSHKAPQHSPRVLQRVLTWGSLVQLIEATL